MKLTKSGPLTDREIDWLEEVLLKYGNDDSVLCFSELDGLLTAIVSGPNTISPNTWLSAIWGRGDYHPRWTTEKEMTRFVGLCFQHMNDIAGCLYEAPEQFEPIFNEREVKGEKYTIVEEWCFGYMKGKSLDDWSGLPGELRPSLEVIALHGVEKNFPVLEKMTGEQFEKSISLIQPAALALYQYWLSVRMSEASSRPVPVKGAENMPGRNDPCPCGSGKKFKKCCLH
ncbi:TPA: YecA family protein [Escherichia coli]|uniref:YecA/YgfB family protein n=1 Tax=Escherichia coli TaxID=562 RepID=UPI0019AB4DAC|nr:YecA family protein [Escherichia coli]MBN6293804.1 YecA family protein [Escherichia coli]HAN6983363.1 YecA family protein [Escherichia coli]